MNASQATRELHIRGLYVASKWISEQCMRPGVEAVPFTVSDQHMLGLGYFQNKEFIRCHATLHSSAELPSLFLAYYSLFLSLAPKSKQLLTICQSLDKLEMDSFLKYLYGICTTDSKLAIQLLCESCVEYPLNWSAWMHLAGFVERIEHLHAMLLSISQLTLSYKSSADQDLISKMTKMFQIHALTELNQNPDLTLGLISELVPFFPSSHLKLQRAMLYHNTRDFDQSQEEFQSLIKDDPLIISGMDIYSNVLYVLQNTVELSQLAHRMVKISKYRPETQMVLGSRNLTRELPLFKRGA